MNRRNRRPGPAAFTLIELLLVISIIAILIMLFLSIWGSTQISLNRMNCQLNLSKCHQVLIQYASNNNSWLPNFGVTDHLESGITESTTATLTQFPMVDELKRYGATAAIFTCPASAAAQDHTYTEDSWPFGASSQMNNSPVWGNWDAVSAPPEGNPPTGFNLIGGYKQVWTYGYVFLCRYYFGDNYSENYWCTLLGGRQMPYKSSQDGTLPLAADIIAYMPNWNNSWYGMAHEPKAILPQNLVIYSGSTAAGCVASAGYPQTGGGNVVFLNGTCQWFDFGTDIMPGLATSPKQEEPVFTQLNPSVFPRGAQYYLGYAPKSVSSKLSN